MKRHIITRPLALLLALTMLLGTLLCACDRGGNPDEPPQTLATPQNLAISATGLITWDAVEHATSYIVTVGDKTYTAGTNAYQVTTSLEVDFNYSVLAKADGYADSASSETKTYQAPRKPPVVKPTVAVAVLGGSEVRPGHSITLTAKVTGTDDQTVIWEIVRGEAFASIDPISGRLTAVDAVEGDGIVEVRAISLADERCFGSKIITVVPRPTLTQDMLDQLAEQGKLGFEGFINISLYKIGINDDLYMTTSTTVKTALDGANWYAEYTNGDLGIMSALYFKNHGGIASQVGVSFMNEEEYAPMLDDDGTPVTWEASGLYNCFVGLRTEDFRFDDELWRYVYVGADDTLPRRMVASANPYDFVPTNLALIIEEGEIMGIYSQSEDDYGIVAGYRAVQEMTVAVNFGETVDVPTITRYQTVEKHAILSEAIQNMQALDSYTLDFRENTASYLTSGYNTSGFEETVLPGDCYFVPYTVRYNTQGEETRTYGEFSAYGYHKISDTLYNTYHQTGEGTYEAARAYAADFAAARPTFAFAAEIFTAYYEDEEDGSITFYVDKPMSGVASTFYYGVGNDIALYGIFATEGYISTGGSVTSFTPYVTVKDGYITEAGFYFYLGSIYGIVSIEYGHFNQAALPEGVDISFTPRQVPTSWKELSVIVTGVGSNTDDDVEKPADQVLVDFFGDSDICKKIPFFGQVLGDTYGFGMTTVYTGANGKAKQAIVFYYDVPLDIDYTIDSSMSAVKDYLTSLGFERNRYDEYKKDGIVVAPVDSSLDFTIYVWRE